MRTWLLVALLLVALLLWAAPAVRAEGPSIFESVGLYGGLAGIDIYTTNKGESQGMVEADPLMKNHTARYVIWGGKTLLMVILDQTLDKGSRRFVRGLNIGLTTVIVGNYFYQENRLRQHPVAKAKQFTVSYTVRW